MLTAKQESARGFTLLELLVGLTLFSVISIALYSGLSMAIKSTATGEKRSHEVRQVMALQTLLNTKVYAAKLAKQSTTSAELAFSGEPHNLSFVSSMPQSIKQGGDGVYSISMQADASEPVLQIALKTYVKIGEAPLNDAINEIVQLADITNFTLKYFGVLNAEKESAWHSSWVEQKSLPLLVKVDLTTKSGSVWPPIVIALREAKKNG